MIFDDFLRWKLLLRRSVEVEKLRNMMRVGVIGGPESRNKLGIPVVVSLQL